MKVVCDVLQDWRCCSCCCPSSHLTHLIHTHLLDSARAFYNDAFLIVTLKSRPLATSKHNGSIQSTVLCNYIEQCSDSIDKQHRNNSSYTTIIISNITMHTTTATANLLTVQTHYFAYTDSCTNK
jgi:hypothetical protein